MIASTLAFLQTRQTWGKFYRNTTERSCLDYYEKGHKTNGYYHIVDDELTYTVYCDMESEPGFAWTLVESFALKNIDLVQFRRRLFRKDTQVRPKSPTWNLYRMSLSQMKNLKERSSHWRITCDFQAKPANLFRDYAVARFKDFDLLTFPSTKTCKLMAYINVRGHHCAECTAYWESYSHSTIGQGIHLQSSAQDSCDFASAKEGSVPSEDNFGFYGTINNKFRCTSSPSATTNYWFGGYF